MGSTMRLLTLSVPALAAVGGMLAPVQVVPVATPRTVLYDQDPDHLWNRVHELQVRVAADGTRCGLDGLDPLLWRETCYLLAGASHARAIRCSTTFLPRAVSASSPIL